MAGWDSPFLQCLRHFFDFFFLEGVTLENGSKGPIFGRQAGGHGHGPGGEKASIPVGKVGNQAGNSVSG